MSLVNQTFNYFAIESKHTLSFETIQKHTKSSVIDEHICISAFISFTDNSYMHSDLTWLDICKRSMMEFAKYV